MPALDFTKAYYTSPTCLEALCQANIASNLLLQCSNLSFGRLGNGLGDKVKLNLGNFGYACWMAT
jgi:hypothetical protein